MVTNQNDGPSRRSSTKVPLGQTVNRWWKQQRRNATWARTLWSFISLLWEFLRESTPEYRRQRYGDADFDWEHHVNTTGGSVTSRDRFVGMFHSPYQPTQPDIFHEVINSLDINFPEFVFIDIGSGKGRALLMAADYPFERIVGIELLSELERTAKENIHKYNSASQRCFDVRSICGDACNFTFPAQASVLYLFNPLSQEGLAVLLANLELSLRASPRPLYLIYHNPVLKHVLAGNTWLKKLKGTHQYIIYTFVSR